MVNTHTAFTRSLAPAPMLDLDHLKPTGNAHLGPAPNPPVQVGRGEASPGGFEEA